MNPGTEGGGMVTRVGDDCLFMVGAHVAHDCQIGDHVIMANNATLGGHVVVEDYAVLGGLCAVHQYVRIGRHAMIGGMSGVERDVIPYGQVMGDRARLCGLNIIGMQRRGFSREDIQGLRNAYQFLFSADGTLSDRVNETAERFGGIGPVDDIIEFIRADSSRAICQPKGDEWRIGSGSWPEAAGCRGASSNAAAPPDAMFLCSLSKERPSRRRCATCRMPGAASAPPRPALPCCAKTT